MLQVEGLILEAGKGRRQIANLRPVILQYDSTLNGGSYIETAGQRKAFSRDRLFELANANRFVGTFTGRHGKNADFEHPQPASGPKVRLRNNAEPEFRPVQTNKTMVVSGRHLRRPPSS